MRADYEPYSSINCKIQPHLPAVSYVVYGVPLCSINFWQRALERDSFEAYDAPSFQAAPLFAFQILSFPLHILITWELPACNENCTWWNARSHEAGCAEADINWVIRVLYPPQLYQPSIARDLFTDRWKVLPLCMYSVGVMCLRHALEVHEPLGVVWTIALGIDRFLNENTCTAN